MKCITCAVSLATVFVVLLAVAAVPVHADDTGSTGELPELTLSFNLTNIYDQTATLHLENTPVMFWAPNQTEPYYQLRTPGWIFEPQPGRSGYRYSTVRITFAKNCKRSLNVSMPSFEPSLYLILYPTGYPVVSPNFTAPFQDLPSFAKEITYRSFNDSDTLSYNFSAGELFLGFRCCAGLFISRSSGHYSVQQTNLTECDITVESFGPTVLVSSLKFFYGTLVLILLPAIITILIHCIMVASHSKAADKSEAAFKRVRCECCFFWIAWVVTFAAYIVLVLVPLY